MSGLKPAYLIWGEDDVKVDAWRARLRKRAEAEGSAATLEVLKDERLSADAAVEAIGSLTLSTGCRYLMMDGVERWKDRDISRVAPVLADLPADTVVVFLAHGDPPKSLSRAVEACGGEVRGYPAVTSRAYPAWLRERALELGLELEREAAELLLERIGHNQRRLLRELEKLSTFAAIEGRVDREAVDVLTSTAVEARAYELADAVVEGDTSRALHVAEDLRAHGEDLMHILFALLRQLRNCHRAWALVASGSTATQIQAELRVPPFVARRLASQAQRTDGERLEHALELLADLDYAIRGAGRLDPDSALTLTLAAATAGRPATVA